MNTKKIKANSYLLLIAIGIAVGMVSCTKYANPDPVFEDYDVEKPRDIARKVLIISIDGAVGDDVRELMPANISGLLDHAKYSWSGLSEEVTSDAVTWASMVTGVNMNKHGIKDDTFRPAHDPDNPHANQGFFPTFFYRILEGNPEKKTSIITPWEDLADGLLVEADTRVIAENDAVVRDSAVSRISYSEDYVTIVNFRDVLTAGLEHGFGLESEPYKNAIEAADGYVGEIMGALESREFYDKEEWLVIVTSNHGGQGTEFGGESLNERNIFTIFNYKDFEPLELTSDYFNSVRFHGWENTGVRAKAQDPEGTYNPGSNSMTIEAKVKFNKNSGGDYNYGWPPFLSKTANRTGSTVGWSFFRAGGGINFWVADGSSSAELSAGDKGNDGLWHSIAGVIEKVSDGYNVKLYVDGSLAAEKNIVSTVAINSPAPLVMGYWPSVFSEQYVDMSIVDVRIWSKALSSSQIKENACLVHIPESHPEIAFLTGNWPAQDGGSKFTNLISGKPDFELEGDYKYSVTGASLPCESGDGAILIQNVDITAQLFYWLGIEPKDDWDLEKQPFLRDFELEFVK